MQVEPYQVILAVVIGLVLSLITFIKVLGIGGAKPRSKGQPTILILGPPSSGKTSLFLKWQEPEHSMDTVTSVVPNESPSFALAESYRLLECPGNEKLIQYSRRALLESNVKAVIFVIDAAAGPESIKSSAKLLFSILEFTEASLVPVLVAANKFDLFSAASLKTIKGVLEQEITEIRETQTHTVPSSEEESSFGNVEKVFLGIDGKNFEFNDLESEVAILDGTVKAGRLQKWERWIENVLSN